MLEHINCVHLKQTRKSSPLIHTYRFLSIQSAGQMSFLPLNGVTKIVRPWAKIGRLSVIPPSIYFYKIIIFVITNDNKHIKFAFISWDIYHIYMNMDTYAPTMHID